METLLGPPELNPKPTTDHQASSSSSGNAFVDAMTADFNKTRVARTPPMGSTERGSRAYLSSGNPCLDFFFHVVPNTPTHAVHEKLVSAWAHDPLTTLKLICNLRGVRGAGKSNKEGFYAAALWLHGLHPKTLACNLRSFAEFGYFKDFAELLYRILEGLEVRNVRRAEWEQRKRGGKKRHRSGEPESIRKSLFKQKKLKLKSSKIKPAMSRDIRIANAAKRSKIEKEIASTSKKEKKIAMAKKVVTIYRHDPEFRYLYDRISDLFAEYLKNDMQLFNSGEVKKISFAAKWCPSIDSAFDKSTLMCESIARKIFPRESCPEYERIENTHYAYRVRDRLRKEVLVPLHKALELPEVYIGAKRWDLIPYERVPSVAMNFYKEKFMKHDPERFAKYLEDVKSGKKKMAAGALLPHEIIMALNDDDGGQIAELQWKRMVGDLLKKGKLKKSMAVCQVSSSVSGSQKHPHNSRLRNSLAVCDVSNSMEGLAMEVSISLGVLISELSEEPWKGKIITFSDNPTLQLIQGDDLMTKTEFVRRMECGSTADFQRVFDLILQVAINGKLKEDEMIKRVFVFSDMEFNQASNNNWETDYRAIVRKFTENGYGAVVPQLVFWNLRFSKATPAPELQSGVALLSGFSKNLLKLFLDRDGDINPEALMEAAISGEEYQKLVVID